MNNSNKGQKLSRYEIQVKNAADAINNLLLEFLKYGSQSEKHAAALEQQIMATIMPLLSSPRDATAAYKVDCDRFLRGVIKAKGLPMASIFTIDVNGESKIDSRQTTSFNQLLPAIKNQTKWCIDNFEAQAQRYLKIRIDEFRQLLTTFLLSVPLGGDRSKDRKSHITGIKREFRSLCDWEDLFCIYKNNSLASALDQLLTLEKGPIAARWRYDSMDAESDAPKNNHQQLDGLIYTVRANWASQSGLMRAGPDGYVDEVDMPPAQEIGCMCHYEWIYTTGSLPENMVIDRGRHELIVARRIISESEERERSNTETKSILARLFGWIQ